MVVPGRAQDDAAEVQPPVARVLQRQHVGLHIAEGGRGLVARTLGKGVDDRLLEVLLARMHGDDLFALLARELVVGETLPSISTPEVFGGGARDLAVVNGDAGDGLTHGLTLLRGRMNVLN